MLSTFDLEPATHPVSPAEAENSDARLMAAIQGGDQHALKLLFDRHRLLLRSVINRVVGNPVEADEVLQECFCELWQRSSTYRADKGEPLGWLVTLVRRRAIDRTRRNISYRHMRDRFELETAPTGAAEASPDGDVDRHDQQAIFSKMIAALPERQQEVVRLSYFRGMSQRQIAASIQQPLGTIKTRLELALRKLRVIVLRLSAFDQDCFARA